MPYFQKGHQTGHDTALRARLSAEIERLMSDALVGNTIEKPIVGPETLKIEVRRHMFRDAFQNSGLLPDRSSDRAQYVIHSGYFIERSRRRQF